MLLQNILVTVTIFVFLSSNIFTLPLKKVVVTGASGRTGSIVFQKLLSNPIVSAIGIIRNKKSIRNLLKLGAKNEQIVLQDFTQQDKLSDIVSVMDGAAALILCTSAVPKIKIWSLIKAFIFKLFGKKVRPQFYFQKRGTPYEVDWLGAKLQIDVAKKAGVPHVVFLSSMGGTQPDNFLNSVGRVAGDELSGNILKWKRRAEEYLIESGLKYTIIHPGGLLNTKGNEKEIVLGVDDELTLGSVRSISREDVAEVCIQALFHEEAKNRSIDIISNPDSNTPTKDWKAFFSQPGNCRY